MRTPAIITDKYIRRLIEEQKQLLRAPCICGHPSSYHVPGYCCSGVIRLDGGVVEVCDCERFTPPAAEPGAERSE